MKSPYIFRSLLRRDWWVALQAVDDAGRSRDAFRLQESWAWLLHCLAEAGHASVSEAIGGALLSGESLLASGRPPKGIVEAALADLEMLAEVVGAYGDPPTGDFPSLIGLTSGSAEHEALVRRLGDDGPESVLEFLLHRYRTRGTGIFAGYLAFRWQDGRLEGVGRPTRDDMDGLFGLERPITRLQENVERFLSGASALHILLYGPRGSGKSTVVRSLLTRYSGEGLRLIEVPPEELMTLPELARQVADAPYRFVAFIDDLSFEGGDLGYRPLRRVLEGSVEESPENLLLIATSNRRHLVRESFGDRPGLENDDVHAWDTTHERLALSDRFGLVLTFPDMDGRSYLDIVRNLARHHSVVMPEAELEREALRFADWGNGYSGRTAAQFISTLIPPARESVSTPR